MSHSKNLDKKIRLLLERAFEMESPEEFGQRIAPYLEGGENGYKYAAFLTVCDTKEKAVVFHAAADSLQGAVDELSTRAKAGVDKRNLDPVWVKLELMFRSEVLPVQAAVDRIFKSRDSFFRRGISFDDKYQFAYTEGELNGNRLLDYKNMLLDLRTINDYALKRDYDVMLSAPKKLIFFDCRQYFADERDRVYDLYDTGNNAGRRMPESERALYSPEGIRRVSGREPRPNVYMSQRDILHVVNTGTAYLARQMHPDGSFDYGYYPIAHKLIKGYNIMRHMSSLWSMVCAADLNSDHKMYELAMSGIRYMLGQIKEYDDGCAYVIEKDTDEIKLGANGVAVILLTQYMNLYKTDEYVKLCEKLGWGILRMMRDDGSFVHVLRPADRSLKEERRTVYYDGEAAFALSRLYSLTGSGVWLEAASRAVDHFIEADYAKYRDHWVAYAVNELTMYKKDTKYYEFALHNVTSNLQEIRNCPTTYHTYLEMLMASYETYRRMVDEKADVPGLADFDVEKFAETIMYRAEYMLNGYGYPEYVMYFKKPSYFRGAFFIRHDRYRTRIDDVQHFCGSYIALYRRYDDVLKLMRS